MTPHRVLAASLAAIALLATLGLGAQLSARHTPQVAQDSSPYFDGYFTPSDQLALSYMSLAQGRYRLGYSLDVRLEADSELTILRCGFVDPTGRIGYLEQGFRVVPATGAVFHLAYEDTFQLPEITVALRCLPSVPGRLGAQFDNVSVTVEPISE